MTPFVVWQRGSLRIVAVHSGDCGGVGCGNDHASLELEARTTDLLGVEAWIHVQGDDRGVMRALVCEVAEGASRISPQWVRELIAEELAELSDAAPSGGAAIAVASGSA